MLTVFAVFCSIWGHTNDIYLSLRHIPHHAISVLVMKPIKFIFKQRTLENNLTNYSVVSKTCITTIKSTVFIIKYIYWPFVYKCNVSYSHSTYNLTVHVISILFIAEKFYQFAHTRVRKGGVGGDLGVFGCLAGLHGGLYCIGRLYLQTLLCLIIHTCTHTYETPKGLKHKGKCEKIDSNW